MPCKSLKFVLPYTKKVTSIDIVAIDSVILQGNYRIYPGQIPCPVSDTTNCPFVYPDSAIYNSGNLFPDNILLNDGVSMSMDFRIAFLQFFPLRYIPASGVLVLYTSVSFTITYGDDSTEYIRSQRITSTRAESIFDLTENLVKNPDDVRRIDGGALEIITERSTTDALNLKTLPAYDTDIPDYIIITNEALEPIFNL